MLDLVKAVEIIDELWDGRKIFNEDEFEFDFPEYTPLSKKNATLIGNVSGDAVDAIQEAIGEYQIKNLTTKKAFRNFILGKLFYYECINIDRLLKIVRQLINY